MTTPPTLPDRDRWQRVRDLFARASELPAGQWGAFLDASCGGDRELRRDIESLLASDAAAGDFLEPAPSTAGGAGPDQAGADPYLGRRIGPYQLLHRLGAGGMGVVYLAVRADDEYQKRVALKLLQPGMDSAEILRRFLTERQILAGLDHPNIARLLDGGTTEDGLPYFVLEYVEGRPLLDYCREQMLDTAGRLELFRQVCAAVHFAHQNLVVHRDLKPGNILVTADGTPKLLDFGIAKLLNPELSAQPLAGAPLAPTVAVRLFTPDHASPEQIRGERITTASDVYSLGVVLYELLTGRHPHRDEEDSRADVERRIREEEPTKPSTAVRALGRGSNKEKADEREAGGREHLRRRLAGDLDHIVLKALRKEPRHRYSSVEQLSEDLHRHAIGLPVLARKGTVPYRVGKFIRRHKAGVAAAGAFLVALLAFGAAMAWQRGEIAAERDRAEAERALAEEERDRAEQVTRFLVELFGESDPFAPRGGAITARELLERGAERIASRFGDRPEVEAALLDAVGFASVSLALYPEAEEHLVRALELRRQIHGPEHPDVAASLHHLGVLRREEGRLEEAEALLEQALGQRLRLLGGENLEVAATRNDLGILKVASGDYASAEGEFRAALALDRRLLGPEHPEVVTTLNNLAAAVYHRGDLEEAEALFRESLTSNRRLLGESHPMVAANLANLGRVLHRRGRLEEAGVHYEEALALRQRLLGPSHPEVANSLYILAELLADRGDPVAAEARAREALGILERMHLGRDRRTELVRGLLGSCLAAQGRFEEAEPLLLLAHRGLEATLGPENPATRRTAGWLVELYKAMGEEEKAAHWRGRSEVGEASP